MSNCYGFVLRPRNMNRTFKTIHSKKTVVRKRSLSPPHDKEHLLKQIDDEIGKGISISNMNFAMKQRCQRNEQTIHYIPQRQSQLQQMIEALEASNQTLLQKQKRNEWKIQQKKNSQSYLNFKELEVLIEDFTEEIAELKANYREIREQKKHRKRLRKEEITKKKEKQIMDQFLFQQLIEEHHQLEEQYAQLKEIYSNARRKFISNHQKKEQLIGDIEILNEKLGLAGKTDEGNGQYETMVIYEESSNCEQEFQSEQSSF